MGHRADDWLGFYKNGLPPCIEDGALHHTLPDYCNGYRRRQKARMIWRWNQIPFILKPWKHTSFKAVVIWFAKKLKWLIKTNAVISLGSTAFSNAQKKKKKLCERLETGIFATSIVQGIRLLRIKSAANKKLQVYFEPTNCNVWD